MDEVARGKTSEAMLDKTARSKVGEAVLGEIAHHKAGELALFKIHARTGMRWWRTCITFQGMMSSKMVVYLKTTMSDQILETLLCTSLDKFL